MTIENNNVNSIAEPLPVPLAPVSYTRNTLIPYVLAGLVIILDIVMMINVINTMESYAILVIPIAQIMFIPPFIALILISNQLKERERRLYYEKRDNTVFRRNFTDKIISASKRLRKMFIIGLLLFLLGLSGLVVVNLTQDRQHDILPLNEYTGYDQEEIIDIIDVNGDLAVIVIRNTNDNYELRRILIDTDTYTLNSDTKLADLTQRYNLIDYTRFNNNMYFIIEFYTDNGSYMSVIRVDFNLLLVDELYSMDLQQQNGLSVTPYVHNYLSAYDGGVNFIQTDFRDTISNVTSISDNGLVSSFLLDKPLIDVISGTDTVLLTLDRQSEFGMRLYRIEHSGFEFTNYSATEIDYTLEFSEPLVLDESFGEYGLQYADGNCATLLLIDDRPYLRTINNILDIDTGISSTSEQENNYCTFIDKGSNGRLRGFAISDQLIFGASGVIEYYDPITLDRVASQGAMLNGYDQSTFFSLVLIDDTLYSSDRSARVFLWSTDIDSINLVSTIRFILIIFFSILMLIGLALLLIKLLKIQRYVYY